MSQAARSYAGSGDGTPPRTVHFIWLGHHVLPDVARMCMDSWRGLNSRWDVRVWDRAAADELQLVNQELFEASLPNFGAASDILRWEVLRQFGGVYADVDVQCLRPMDELFAEWPAGAVVGHRGGHVENAVLAATAGHGLAERAVWTLGTWFRRMREQATVMRTGPRYVQEVVADHLRVYTPPGTWRDGFVVNDVAVLPACALYPAPDEPGTAFTAHHWINSWMRPGVA